tara:strand:- start:52 stop:1014 length:963 start_codon:yes stop_codon:yes gene_type:complete
MKKKIIIVAGDPNSINTEIIYKTWKKLSANIKKNVFIIGNYNLIKAQFKKLKINKKIVISNINSIDRLQEIKIINVPLKFNNPFKVSLNSSSKYVLKCLDLAHNFSIQKKTKGIINCPIDKKLLKKTKKIGVTELLASKFKNLKKSEVMMLYNKNLAVVPLTTHVPVRKVSSNINKDIIINKVITLNKNYKKLFKKKPNIGILGLNPHNGELEKKSEEVIKIIPAITNLRHKNIKVKGPLVADTLFINNYQKYDVIVGMYHDQVLGPFKTLFGFDAINMTLGLSYNRVSPDHGPANDLIGKNSGNYISLLKCINLINKLS